AAIFLIVIATLMYLTFERNKVWQDEITLWTDGVKKSPHEARTYLNLGIGYMNLGRYDDSISELSKSLKEYPQNYGAYNNRGICYFLKGDFPKAVEDFNTAILLKPEDA